MKEWLVYKVPKQTFALAVPEGETLLPLVFMSCIPSIGCNCSTEIYLLLMTEHKAPESRSIKVWWLLIFPSTWATADQRWEHASVGMYSVMRALVRNWGTPCSSGESTPSGVSLTPTIPGNRSAAPTDKAFYCLLSSFTIPWDVAQLATCRHLFTLELALRVPRTVSCSDIAWIVSSSFCSRSSSCLDWT